MFRSAAEVIGCLVAPIPIVGVVVVESILHTYFDLVVVLLFSLIAYFSALAFTMVLGYPLYRLLSRLRAFSWWTSILSGFVIGVVASFSVTHNGITPTTGVIVNWLAAAASGLLFWVVQRMKWRKRIAR
ncbi:hypothetical protein [Dyella acidiphila]|uniref:Uncharacterized protein n=1 Tax=Dyella acidiphila TaxID=2775866 RepID=A0ABR9GDR3_9GAMM|nr:hypothetical protein [Dyella acidiphila]MBE1162192.1 hypothetical protein [Dyella acidiphila]